MRLRLLLGLLVVMACGEVKSKTPDGGGLDECMTDAQCGTHQFCNTASPMGRVCECVNGYSTGTNGCTFTGSIKDPGFSDPSKWTVSNGALVNTTAPGKLDVGEVNFVKTSLCGFGTVEQDIGVPPIDRAEPLVIEVSLSNPPVRQQVFDQIDAGLAINNSWIDIPPGGTGFRTVRMCLGDIGYAAAGHGKGDTVRLKLGPMFKPASCPTPAADLAFDRIEIKPASAGECPPPGQAINGDAEGTGGWAFTVSGSSSGGLAAGTGAGGTKGARITLGARCDNAVMTNSVSVPKAGSPALEFFYNATAGAKVAGSLPTMGLQLPLPAATGTGSLLRFCLPPILKGTMIPLQLFVGGGVGSCADILNTSAIVDNLRVVDDPACGTDPIFGDAGFESAPNRPLGSNRVPETDIVVSATVPHAGKGALDLFTGANCTTASYLALPIVPAPQGTAGPAFKFFYRIPGANPNSVTTVRAGTTVTLNEGSASWVAQTLCLDPKAAGHPVQVQLFNNQTIIGTVCDTVTAAEHSFFDDFSVGTDPSCPAQ